MQRRRLEATSTATSTGTFTGLESLPIHSQNTHAGMGIRNRRTLCAHGY